MEYRSFRVTNLSDNNFLDLISKNDEGNKPGSLWLDCVDDEGNKSRHYFTAWSDVVNRLSVQGGSLLKIGGKVDQDSHMAFLEFDRVNRLKNRLEVWADATNIRANEPAKELVEAH